MGKYMNQTGHRACIDRQRPVILSRDDRKSEKTSIELRNDFPPISPQTVDRRVPASLLCEVAPPLGCTFGAKATAG